MSSAPFRERGSFPCECGSPVYFWSSHNQQNMGGGGIRENHVGDYHGSAWKYLYYLLTHSNGQRRLDTSDCKASWGIWSGCVFKRKQKLN